MVKVKAVQQLYTMKRFSGWDYRRVNGSIYMQQNLAEVTALRNI
jgi:hypothetical protein